jgi:hypothetical protein
MKTLDEVIYLYENRKSLLIGKATRDEMEEDILYYLKKYRDNFEARNDQVERYQRAAKECEEILTDYVALKQYWAEQQANNPLTWSELKQMEGKPVWIELLGKGHWKGWDVIGGFYTDDFGDAMCTARLDDYYLTDLDKTWQAYRKERHELDQKAH